MNVTEQAAFIGVGARLAAGERGSDPTALAGRPLYAADGAVWLLIPVTVFFEVTEVSQVPSRGGPIGSLRLQCLAQPPDFWS